MVQYGILKQFGNLYWNRDRRASIWLMVLSQKYFLSEWVRTANFG